jgi:hypothetical protein
VINSGLRHLQWELHIDAKSCRLHRIAHSRPRES